MSNDEPARPPAEEDHGNREGPDPQDGPKADELEKAGINPEALKDEKVKKAIVNGEEPTQDDEEGDEHQAAAAVLQRRYRAYQKQREQSGMNLNSSARWNDALKNSQMKKAATDAGDGKNDPGTRWQRTGFYAGRLVEGGGAGTNDDGGQGEAEDEEQGITGKEGTDGLAEKRKHNAKVKQKQMDAKYWLEMVDTKHRYASNLNTYHQHWNQHYDGDQNFFYWLDQGDGKDLDLEDSCPRSRLDSEKITYLSAEQRLNYLVRIDNGKLVWARDKRPVDTSRGHHKDLGDGRGIVDATEEEVQAAKDRGEIRSDSSSSSSSASSDEEANAESQQEGAHHYGTAQAGGPLSSKEKLKENFSLSPKHVMDRLLRSTLNANTWIFVCDLKGNLYVGIKQTGRFQHSSFLFGSRVMAAGLIKVRHGQLRSLSPLSGHYRAGTVHFKGFVERLEEAGCDMSRVSISKSLVIIGGIEKYGRFNKRKSKFVDKLKKRLVHPIHGRAPGEDVEEKSEQQKDDERLNDRVGAARKEDMKRNGQVATDAGTQERANLERERRGGGPSALPHEGKKIDDLTYDERIERGAAIMVRATQRGMGKKEGEDDKKHGKESAISPDADQALADAKKEREESTGQEEQQAQEENPKKGQQPKEEQQQPKEQEQTGESKPAE